MFIFKNSIALNTTDKHAVNYSIQRAMGVHIAKLSKRDGKMYRYQRDQINITNVSSKSGMFFYEYAVLVEEIS